MSGDVSEQLASSSLSVCQYINVSVVPYALYTKQQMSTTEDVNICAVAQQSERDATSI